MHGWGPNGPRATTSRPAQGADQYGLQTWFQDASGPGKKDGTVINAEFLNTLVAERLAILDAASAADNTLSSTSNVVSDTFLLRCILALIDAGVVQNVDADYIAAKLDAAIGTGWRASPPDAGQIVAAIDGMLGTDWRAPIGVSTDADNILANGSDGLAYLNADGAVSGIIADASATSTLASGLISPAAGNALTSDGQGLFVGSEFYVSSGIYDPATKTMRFAYNTASKPDIIVDVSSILGVSSDAGNRLTVGADGKATLAPSAIATIADFDVNNGAETSDLLLTVQSIAPLLRYDSANSIFAFGTSAAEGATGTQVSASGYAAAYQNSGSNVSASGWAAAYQNTGSQVSASGWNAAQSNSGNNVSASGGYAAQSNSGNNVSATGGYAAQQNTGDNVSASGWAAAYQNTGNTVSASGWFAARLNTGNFVSADGYYAAYSNSGSIVSATGAQAAYLNSGDNISADGYYAARENTGDNVSAAGWNAARENAGNFVSAAGWNAARENTGNNVDAFGYYAGFQNTFSNVTLLGKLSAATANNQAVLGGPTQTPVGYAPFASISDARDKLIDDGYDQTNRGLPLLLALTPRAYRLNPRARYVDREIVTVDGGNDDGTPSTQLVVTQVENDGSRADPHRSFAFIAQDVRDTALAFGLQPAEVGVIDTADAGGDGTLLFSPERLVGDIVLAIKTLSERADAVSSTLSVNYAAMLDEALSAA
jgi:hypothetical protein